MATEGTALAGPCNCESFAAASGVTNQTRAATAMARRSKTPDPFGLQGRKPGVPASGLPRKVARFYTCVPRPHLFRAAGRPNGPKPGPAPAKIAAPALSLFGVVK